MKENRGGQLFGKPCRLLAGGVDAKSTISTPGKLYSNRTYDGTQTFSDRFSYAKVVGEAISRYFNFTSAAQDQAKVTLTSDGKMAVKLITWGGVEINVQPTECMNNLMYGFGNGVLYSVTLNHGCIPG